MSVIKSLVDKVQQKKEELEEEAAKRAAKKAAEVALERGKEVALAAVEQAGRSLKSAGATIEEALFGPDSEADPGEGREARRTADEEPEARGERGRREPVARRAPPAPAVDEARFQREVDQELEALKRKIARE